MAILSFLLSLLAFVALGAASVVKSRKTTDDYYLASQEVKPWLAGLSAVATNNSGYMFIGMIGLTYTTGWSSVWLMIGWILGDLCGSFLVLRRLREAAISADVHSFPQLLARWHGTRYARVRVFAALLTVVFLGTYAAAQMKAGGMALHVLFGWEMHTGAILGAAIVLVYSIVGGIRASIWTDAAQSFVMLGAMLMLMFVGLDVVGGWGAMWRDLEGVAPDYMTWFGGQGGLEALLVVMGWFFAGLAVLGQPHVMVRFMAFDDSKHVGQVRLWYYSWFTIFYGSTIVVGLLTRLILPEVESFDAELALPTMAGQLLPDILVGLALAGLFAATISTADSLVLACSSALTQDLRQQVQGNLRLAKMATAGVVIFALSIALTDSQTVFRLVLVAWGVLGAAFAPLVLIYARGGRPKEWQALVTMAGGVLTFYLWRALGFSEAIYEVLPAILAGLAIYGVTAVARRV